MTAVSEQAANVFLKTLRAHTRLMAHAKEFSVASDYDVERCSGCESYMAAVSNGASEVEALESGCAEMQETYRLLQEADELAMLWDGSNLLEWPYPEEE